jgi:hypothetical protein
VIKKITDIPWSQPIVGHGRPRTQEDIWIFAKHSDPAIKVERLFCI